MTIRHRKHTGVRTTEVAPRELKNRKIAREAAVAGIVLAKNEGGFLPLDKSRKVALYGAGATKTVKGGTGSGEVNERESVSIYEGMKQAGFAIANEAYLKAYDDEYVKLHDAWRDKVLSSIGPKLDFWNALASTPFITPAGEAVTVKEDDCDTAIYVLSRIAGEGADRLLKEGDYYITEEEKKLIESVAGNYENVVLLINTGGIVDLSFVDDFTNIRSILMISQPGQEGGAAVADILSGAATPSGKLTDTWPLHYEDIPCSAHFGALDGNPMDAFYEEGIYVGYRYYDTFEVPVRYGFGHGLSYTDFSMGEAEVSLNKKEGLASELPSGCLGAKTSTLKVSVKVTNTGDTYSGKEVVQVYVACPQIDLPKEFRRLAGFAKTHLLAPGESETITVEIPIYLLSSYDEKKSAYILQGGKYGIYVGSSLAGAKLMASMDVDHTKVLASLSPVCPVQKELNLITAPVAKVIKREMDWKLEAEKMPSVLLESDTLDIGEVEALSKDSWQIKAEEIAATLSVDELILLATGDPAMGQGSVIGNAGQSVPGSAAETTSALEDKGIASIVLADGPAGIRLHQTYEVKDDVVVKRNFQDTTHGGIFSDKKEDPDAEKYYQYCTAIPVGTLLAQTFDVDLLDRVGQMVGEEMGIFEVTLWLAPGMNIHRNPLCGRNFEYYSEDPLVSGRMAGAITRGVQSKRGCGTTIKHYACNNQEDKRMEMDSIVSERALREIFLKGFEIAIKEAGPMAIMTSYNRLNGIHTANNYDLCTKLAREEWGFKGMIMTDWETTIYSYEKSCSAAGCIKAGNDIVMPGIPADHDSIRASLADGSLTEDRLRECVTRTIRTILSSNQYE